MLLVLFTILDFALNCGAKSCPPLRSFSFEKIEGELDFAAESFLDEDVEIDKEKKQVTKRLQLNSTDNDIKNFLLVS